MTTTVGRQDLMRWLMVGLSSSCWCWRSLDTRPRRTVAYLTSPHTTRDHIACTPCIDAPTTPTHVRMSVCLSVCYDRQPCKNGWTAREVVCGVNSLWFNHLLDESRDASRERAIMGWRWDVPRTLSTSVPIGQPITPSGDAWSYLP